VIAAPALIKLGVPDYAAHMFIFYYAVLSEVSPPTALSPFAAAAITGGDPYKTTLQSWKYTLPAFLVPFMLCSTRRASACCSIFGAARGSISSRSPQDHARADGTGGRGAGWALRHTTLIERALLVLSGTFARISEPDRGRDRSGDWSRYLLYLCTRRPDRIGV
jgi:hypothetical protein